VKKLGDKISEDDKETIEKAVKETLDWLEENPTADKDQLSEKQKELEAVCNPIISKLYQQHGGPSGGPGGEEEGEPHFDEHDDL